MQQLSLFDFGEEAPKPEKKKKASKNVTEQSGSATNTEKTPNSTILEEASDAQTQIQAETTNEPTDNSIAVTAKKAASPLVEERSDTDGDQKTASSLHHQTEDVAEQPSAAEPSKEENTAATAMPPASIDAAQIQNLTADQSTEKKITKEEADDQRDASFPFSELEAETEAEAETETSAELKAGTSTIPEIKVNQASPDPSSSTSEQLPEELKSDEPTRDVVFANEQFGVKVVSRNTAVPEGHTDNTQVTTGANPASNSPAENPERPPQDDIQGLYNDHPDSNALTAPEEAPKVPDGVEEESGVDTSFSPSDFEIRDLPEEQMTPESLSGPTETGTKENNNKGDESIDAGSINKESEQIPIPARIQVPVPPKIIENKDQSSSINKESEAHQIAVKESEKQENQKAQDQEAQLANNQTIEADNTAKPNYIEDKAVPIKKRGRMSFKQIDAEVDLIQIPPDEELFQKQYYPISVVAKWFRVNNSLLRFWENEFKILKPKKNKKGDRFFRPEDVKNLQLIYYLLRQKKLTISGAIKHLNSYKEQTEANMQLIQTLTEFKGFLLELKHSVEK